MKPGETRRVGYVFLSHQEAVDHLRSAKKFYAWESGHIGETAIVDSEDLDRG